MSFRNAALIDSYLELCKTVVDDNEITEESRNQLFRSFYFDRIAIRIRKARCFDTWYRFAQKGKRSFDKFIIDRLTYKYRSLKMKRKKY